MNLLPGKNKGDHPKAPQKLEDLVLPEILTTTGQKFLQYDNGPKEENRLIMFWTDASLEFLANSDVWFMDGTVRSGPALFDQIYTIHGMYPFYIRLEIVSIYT